CDSRLVNSAPSGYQSWVRKRTGRELGTLQTTTGGAKACAPSRTVGASQPNTLARPAGAGSAPSRPGSCLSRARDGTLITGDALRGHRPKRRTDLFSFKGSPTGGRLGDAPAPSQAGKECNAPPSYLEQM